MERKSEKKKKEKHSDSSTYPFYSRSHTGALLFQRLFIPTRTQWLLGLPCKWNLRDKSRSDRVSVPFLSSLHGQISAPSFPLKYSVIPQLKPQWKRSARLVSWDTDSESRTFWKMITSTHWVKVLSQRRYKKQAGIFLIRPQAFRRPSFPDCSLIAPFLSSGGTFSSNMKCSVFFS